MALRQVHHMDVIAHSGAVRRGVIIAEHPQVVQLAHGHRFALDAPHTLAFALALLRTDSSADGRKAVATQRVDSALQQKKIHEMKTQMYNQDIHNRHHEED